MRVRRLQSRAGRRIDGRAGRRTGPGPSCSRALAAAYMLDRRLDEAIEYGERSRDARRATGRRRASRASNTDATLGSVLLFAGRMDEGWRAARGRGRPVPSRRSEEAEAGARLPDARHLARRCSSSTTGAERWLRRGHRVRRARPSCGTTALHGRAPRPRAAGRPATGTRAEQTAEHALADGRGGITTRITALYVLGYLALGRGELDRARQACSTRRSRQGESMGELQRLSPPLWGLAEAALLRGDRDRAVELCERGYAASARVQRRGVPVPVPGHRHPGAAWPPATAAAAADWVDRVRDALLGRGHPGHPAGDRPRARAAARCDAGDLAAATRAWPSRGRGGWAARHRFWEGTWAALDLARAAAGRRPSRRGRGSGRARPATAAEATGRAAAGRRGRRLRRRRAPAGGEQPWHPLTAREFEVARWSPPGLTNRRDRRPAVPLAARRCRPTSSTSWPSWAPPGGPRSPPGPRRSTATVSPGHRSAPTPGSGTERLERLVHHVGRPEEALEDGVGVLQNPPACCQ